MASDAERQLLESCYRCISFVMQDQNPAVFAQLFLLLLYLCVKQPRCFSSHQL